MLDIQPKWHTYWRNPGESGLAPTFAFTAPEGIIIGAPVWPTPTRHKLPSGGVDYVYEGKALVLFPVRVDTTDREIRTSAEIAVKIDWLVCDEVCLPGTKTVSLTIPISTQAGPSGYGEEFDAARARVPVPVDEALPLQTSIEGDTVVITYQFARELEFFPYESESLAQPIDALAQGFSNTGTIRFTLDRVPNDMPSIEGIVRYRNADDIDAFYEVRIPAPNGATP